MAQQRKGVKATAGHVKSLMKPSVLPAIKGEGADAGGVDYPCAGCGFIVAENVSMDTIHGIGIQCPNCHTITYWD
jgi:DNA-directed RNA polymerase subunit RPC12/RpoP